jgi:hypothetical protein
MLDLLPTRACWTRAGAEAVLKIEALEGDDALFLATHTPVRGFEVVGTHRQDIADKTEAGLLDALAEPTRRHAFCVVQGEPGSGKSHLIRWLSVNWPVASDVTLLLQRADGSLEGALNQLKTRLTRSDPEFAALFEDLGQRHNARMSGRAAVFQSTLAHMLKSDYFEHPRDDAAWCDQHDLDVLIQNLHVRRNWRGPRRILEMIDGKAEQRNSETASFNLEDILDLARVAEDVNDTGPSKRFALQLLLEADEIEEAQKQGHSSDDIRRTMAGQFGATFGLMAALNRRRNDAVQSVIGVSAAALKRVFERVRGELARRGQRLVLLLEDITSWEGLDDSLIDSLVLNSETRAEGDLSPIISVVGVTPEYYADLAGNYRQRITHEVQLGRSSGVLQDAAATRDAMDRSAFVARYLNAARAGISELAIWREGLRDRRDLPPPIRCETCVLRPTCHATFGDIDGIGLFPFTSHAVERFFSALKADDRGQTHRTPRGLLQSVLGPTLRNPSMLDDDRYPGPDIETDTFDERERLIAGPMRTLLDVRESDPARRDRLRRTIIFWGDKTSVATARQADGTRTFADTPQAIFTAFGLPWLGDDGAPGPTTSDSDGDARDRTARPSSDVQPARETSRPDGDEQPPRGTSPPRDDVQQPGATIVGTKRKAAAQDSPTTKRIPKTELEKLNASIIDARDGGPIRDAAIWNAVLFDLVQKLDPRALGFDRWTWSTLFTSSTVMIEGAGQVRAASFVVPRKPWVYDGLEAHASLRGSGPLDEVTKEYHRRRLAFMLRRLGLIAAAHAGKRRPRLPDGAPWNMTASATQVLLARAWLRGAVSPDAPTAEQWRVLLSDEGAPVSNPLSRTEPWQEALRNTDQQHDKLRVMLREMVSIPQGNSADFGLADAGAAAQAILRLKKDFAFSPISTAASSTAFLDDLDLRFTAAKTETYLPRILALEQNLLRDRAIELESLCHGASVRARADRLNRNIGDAFLQLKQSPDLERRWREEWQRQLPLLSRPDALRAVERLIVAFTTEHGLPQKSRADLLGWLAEQPAGDLKTLLELFKSGEATVQTLLGPVRAYVQSGRGVDLSAVHTAGKNLAEASRAARRLVTDHHA